MPPIGGTVGWFRRNKRKDEPTMSDNLPATDDGLGDEGDVRLIKGTRLKFIDGVWSTKDGVPPPSTALFVTKVFSAVQRWADKRVAECFIAKPLPDVDALN